MGAEAFVLLGPTASGKSTLVLQLAGEFPIEIVSMDSAQVYRGMDIGTAKPSAAERSRVPHHLLDLIEPTEAYSAGRFREDAVRVVQEILARGRIPLIVGGTMLYYRALASGLDALPQADRKLRAELDADAARRGWPALHAELARIDPPTAARLDVNDAQRVQRALEVHRLTGKPLSALQGSRDAALPFELAAFALVPADRAELHQRIAARFDAMLAAGLVAELAALRARHALSAGMPSMRCVGYRQAWAHLEGEFGARDLRERGIAATRQLAKRQLTWLRSLPDLRPAAELYDALRAPMRRPA
ncbi:MAG: tRNA (adenosine(37)-N6)-dimethylallyltransferase MiaA [Burkholderiales bacterium]